MRIYGGKIHDSDPINESETRNQSVIGVHENELKWLKNNEAAQSYKRTKKKKKKKKGGSFYFALPSNF